MGVILLVFGFVQNITSSLDPRQQHSGMTDNWLIFVRNQMSFWFGNVKKQKRFRAGSVGQLFLELDSNCRAR